ncbi:hypothetical protein K490DRAFT_47874 [Saccharata proteae CBS 121410]|uniref:WD40 repeat-like protein n=1 Tax=Saccharata proteae CBS 121410 TaxID=1314787 RepID=A0A9P4LV85_9PEZI|nr:hypothetical protein K490DRAFT_47874 [Saccharata proteae CBS 121410]
MHQNSGKSYRIASLFGSLPEDLEHILKTRKKWFEQATMPTHKTSKKGHGGMAYPSIYTAAIRQHESTKGWEWYHERGGEDAFRRRQETRVLSEEESKIYLPNEGASKNVDFLMGPIQKPKLFTLRTAEALNITTAWSEMLEREPSHSRSGWIFNLGGKLQWLQWVANQSGSTQYLAAATLQKPPQDFPPWKNPVAPGFSPTIEWPASIQIWDFKTYKAPGDGKPVKFSTETPPRLSLLLCTKWGPIKQFHWCPLATRESGPNAAERDDIHLGLLAGIWGDGKVRVLDIRYPKSSSPIRIRVDRAAFEAKPPNSIFTSVCWLSATQIAAGTADGSLAIFDIARNPHSSPRPWFYQSVHSSYITSVTSGWPSRPHLLCTASMDGYQRLLDIRSPSIDTLLSQRSRMGSASVTWYEPGQAFIVIDENYTIHALSARRFHMSMACGKAPASILTVAASILHPFMLMGSTDGSVTSTNSLRKIMISKAQMWHQTWFRHEWRAPLKNAAPSTTTTSPGYAADIFKIWVDNGLPNQYEGVVYNTLYEEAAGVTAVAWNPNLCVGGWAAAGMADGLVRVEDLAV